MMVNMIMTMNSKEAWFARCAKPGVQAMAGDYDYHDYLEFQGHDDQNGHDHKVDLGLPHRPK